MPAKTKSFDDVDRELKSIEDKLPKASILKGHQLDGIALDTSETAVPHRLGRPLVGYLIVGSSSGASVWGETASNAVNLYLQASAPVTVSLWVY